MSNKLDRLTVDHDFAPGAAPGAVEVVMDRLADVFIAPEFTLAFFGVLIPLALYILVKSQLRETRRCRSAGPAAAERGKTDFASIRRARMPGAGKGSRGAADDAA